ncbi:MAG: MMPL family transporter [Actinobacteria bacterium]|nr:MMPL family transporter [Actinomycetota bacterium]
MGALSRWAVRRPGWALAAFAVLAVVIFGLGGRLGGELKDSFELPDTESLQAQKLLEQLPDSQNSGATAITATVVWSPDAQGATAVSPETAATIVPLLTEISKLDGVACVTNPFDQTGAGLGTACPPAQAAPDLTQVPAEQQEAFKAALQAAQQALSPVSADGTVAKATITFDGGETGDEVSTETAKGVIDAVKKADATDGLTVGASGQVLEFAGQEPPSSEAFGMLVALVILLIAFGSFLAAGLPLLTAGFGVGLGASLLLYIANFYDVATFAPTLAAMIGLGVGIDYSLFVINRYRQAILAGHEPKQAAMEAVNTSGRAVVFAASTVIIGLLGLLFMGIGFFTGLAFAASGTVLLVMLSAVWLLPALLSLLGHRAVEPVSLLVSRGLRTPGRPRVVTAVVLLAVMAVLSAGVLSNADAETTQKVVGAGVVVGVVALVALLSPLFYRITRHARHDGEPWHPEGGRWAHYARLLQKRPIIPALVSLGLVLLLAVPALSLRLGFPDDSGKPEGSIARTAYDLQSEGFGPGSNGPFLVAAQLPKDGDLQSLGALVAALEKTEGVASVTPSSAMLPLLGQQLQDQSITAIQVTPTTGPQSEETDALLDRLREETIPAVEAQIPGLAGYVGGATAIVADFSTVLTDAMPLFLSVVVGLGFLMLMILFRAPVVSLTAVVTSLLSFAASTGITVAVFQWGWLNGLLGVSGTGPIFPFLPVMVFAILFGLSMDYHVFLVSRMQEEWARTHDNATAVRRGLAGSGRVVLMAALIMFSVFAAFIPTPNNTIKLFGVALASAVLVDAFLIRLVFVPAFMSLLGNANWWLPKWLDKILPHFDVEGGADEITDDEPDAIGEPEPVGTR